MADNAFTLFALDFIGVPPYSARGLKQTFGAISGQAQLKRTVNGNLKDLGETSFRKYASTVSGADVDPPALEGVWAGLIVVVDCLFELAVAAPHASRARDVVPGSERTEAGFIYYRPRLTMMVTDFNVNRDEWGAANSWTLNLEEV